MRPLAGNRLAIEQLAKDLHGFGQPGLSHRWWIKRPTNGRVFGEGVSSTNANLESTPTEVVQAGELSRQMHRMVKVVVQDQWADSELGRTVGRSHQRRQGRPSIDDVIARVQDIESHLLGGASL